MILCCVTGYKAHDQSSVRVSAGQAVDAGGHGQTCQLLGYQELPAEPGG